MKKNIYCLAVLWCVLPTLSFAGIMTPAAQSLRQTSIFARVGYTNRQAYGTEPDMIASFGIAGGDPAKYFGLQVVCNILDVSDQKRYSFGAQIYRYFGYGTSIAIGADNLFANETDSPESYYGVLSHTLRYNVPPENMLSRITLSIGGGNGRYYEKSERDAEEGKGEHGIGVFGSIEYQMTSSITLLVDWSGTNLHAGMFLRPFRRILSKQNMSLGILLGAVDLTEYSGDGVRFIADINLRYHF